MSSLRQPRILIVYNFTRHLTRSTHLLEKQISNPRIDIVRRTHVAQKDIKKYDLIILTGGNGRKLLFDSEKLQAQKSLIRQASVPVVGICFGAELIALTFGGKLEEMHKVRRWYIPIHFVSHSSIKLDQSSVKVYEGHKIKITELPDFLETIATSKDGIEIFRHRTKPIYGLQFHPEVSSQYDHGAQIFGKIVKLLLDS